MRFIALLFCVLLGACSSDPQSGDESLQAAKKMFDAFNRHQWKEMADHYSDSAFFLDPSFGKQYIIQSREETAAKYAEMEKVFPDLHDEIVNMYASRDQVTIEFVSTGTMNDITPLDTSQNLRPPVTPSACLHSPPRVSAIPAFTLPFHSTFYLTTNLMIRPAVPQVPRVSFTLPIATILTFKDGFIVKEATYYDVENP